jgi:hypothetical protein
MDPARQEAAWAGRSVQETPWRRVRGELSVSSTAATRPPGGPPPEPELTAEKDQLKARGLGVSSATGLVIGSIVGIGEFTMQCSYKEEVGQPA